MKLFSKKEQYQSYNIYSLKKYVDKKRIIFNIIVSILITITLILVLYYVIDTALQIKKSKQFRKQIVEYREELNKKNEQAKNPKLTDVGKENIKKIYNSETKRAFLTFDDGPSKNTNDILNILQENNIKATFFVLGSQVEKMPEMTKKIYDEGHYIANHGYSHVYSSIYQSPEQVLNEYNKCNQIIANAIGVPEYNSHLFRFPGGSVGGYYAQIKEQAITLLEQNNILYVDWNELTGDSEKANPTEEYLMNNLQRTTKEKNSIVLLMHDSQSKIEAVEFLPKVIEYLKQKGYEFENFYNIIK